MTVVVETVGTATLLLEVLLSKALNFETYLWKLPLLPIATWPAGAVIAVSSIIVVAGFPELMLTETGVLVSGTLVCLREAMVHGTGMIEEARVSTTQLADGKIQRA